MRGLKMIMIEVEMLERKKQDFEVEQERSCKRCARRLMWIWWQSWWLICLWVW